MIADPNSVNQMKNLINIINKNHEDDIDDDEFLKYAQQERQKILEEQRIYEEKTTLDMSKYYGTTNTALVPNFQQEMTGEYPSQNVSEDSIELLPEIIEEKEEELQDIDMEDVVDKFHNSVNNVAETLVEDSKYEPAIKEHLMTKKTPTGIQVGKYDIIDRQDPDSRSSKKIYDIADSNTSYVLASDIRLYETANALVKLLNNGKKITDFTVLDILNLEDSFQSHRNDAAMYKRKMNESLKKGDDQKVLLYEARYDKSKEYAIRSARRIRDINDRLRFE